MVKKTVTLTLDSQKADLFGEFLAEYIDENVEVLSKELFDILDGMRRQIFPEAEAIPEQETYVEGEEVEAV